MNSSKTEEERVVSKRLWSKEVKNYSLRKMNFYSLLSPYPTTPSGPPFHKNSMKRLKKYPINPQPNAPTNNADSGNSYPTKMAESSQPSSQKLSPLDSIIAQSFIYSLQTVLPSMV